MVAPSAAPATTGGLLLLGVAAGVAGGAERRAAAPPFAVTLTPDTLILNGASQFRAQLMGVTAYEAHGDYFWYDPSLGGRWLEEWGVEAIGVGNDGYPLPPGCTYNSSSCPVVGSGVPGDKRDNSSGNRCPGPSFDEDEIRAWYSNPGPGGASRWFYDYPAQDSVSGRVMFGKMIR